jgi:hypothetical protein
MIEKRVSLCFAAVGGRQVRTELKGASEAGSRGFERLSREIEAANARLAAFSRWVRVAVAAAAAAGVAMIRAGFSSVEAQAELAQSLGTTAASIHTLERAGELAGVSMSGIEQSNDAFSQLGLIWRGLSNQLAVAAAPAPEGSRIVPPSAAGGGAAQAD